MWDSRPLIFSTHEARCLIFNGSWPWHNRLLILDGDLEAKLQLCLSSTIELFVNGGIVRVEDDKGSGAVRVTLEDSLGGRWDGEEVSQLRNQTISAWVPQGKVVDSTR